jgi:type II secretory pathway pseudopilin PulG
MQRIRETSHDGFTLLETLIATGILVTAIAGIFQLVLASVRSTREGGLHGTALVAAQDKLEHLRSLPFGYDLAGVPITSEALAPSQSQSLSEDIDGFVDFIDGDGRVSDDASGVFTRRWRITPIDQLTPEALAIEVCVFRSPADGLTPSSADACLATVRARQP